MDRGRLTDNQRVWVRGNRSGFRKVMASRSLGFFLVVFGNTYFRGWKMLKIAPCTPAFSFVCCVGRRPASIEPKILGVHGREVDLRVSGVSETPGGI